MIVWECPYTGCSCAMLLPLAEYGWEQHVCPECRRTVWTLHSRVAPCSHTADAFAERFVVDEEQHTITERIPPNRKEDPADERRTDEAAARSS